MGEESFSAVDFAAIAVVLALTVLSLVRGVSGAWGREWRNEEGSHPDRPGAYWPLGPTLWRGQNRIFSPLATFGGIALAAFVAAAAIGVDWLMRPLGLVWAACIVLVLSITLLARPKWAIAPHLRHQPSAFAEWLGAEVRPTSPPEKLADKPAARSRRGGAPLRGEAERLWFTTIISAVGIVCAVAGLGAIYVGGTGVGVGLLCAAVAAGVEVIRQNRISRRADVQRERSERGHGRK